MSEITLYPHQEIFLDRINKSLSENDSVIACSPGGTGKTKCFITMGRRANAKKRTALIITDRLKVFSQIRDEAAGIVIDSDTKHLIIEPGKLYVAMAQSMVNRPFIISQFNSLPSKPLVIVDECHCSTPNRLVKQIYPKFLTGFTATPHVRWAKHLPELYNDCIVSEQIDWFIQNGWLCNYQHIERQKENSNILKIQNGEYSESSQDKFFGSNELYAGLIEDLHKYPFKKCMVFCSSIKRAEETYTMLCEAGFACSIAHSKRADESYQLGMFRVLKQTNILVSVGSMTTGYDDPEVDQVVLYRATTSLPLYLQMCYRANRKKPSMFFRVLDYGSNGTRHGLYWQDRDWETLWKKDNRKARGEDGSGVAPIKVCVQCECLIPSTSRICPYCNTEQPLTEKELQEGVLVDLTEKYLSLSGRSVSTLNPEELATYAKSKARQKFCARVARSNEQSNPGFLLKYAAAMGYNPAWCKHQQPGTDPIEFYDIVIR